MSFKALGFDVGICNLAFCALELDRSLKLVKITDWDVVDLLELLESQKPAGAEVPRTKCVKLPRTKCVKVPSIKSVTVPSLIRALVAFLSARFEDAKEYDAIVVEQQNARQACQRKFVHVSYAIYQHFLTVNQNTSLASANLKFVARRLPELGWLQPKMEPMPPAAREYAASTMKKKLYDHRKRHCVAVAADFLRTVNGHHEENQAYSLRLSAGDKTDSDAADALLMCLSAMLVK